VVVVAISVIHHAAAARLFVAPGIAATFDAAGDELPFRFGRESVASIFAVGLSAIPGHARHGRPFGTWAHLNFVIFLIGDDDVL
jgi:hypothetical protein